MAAKKGGLGRGLDLLFQDTGASSADDGVTMLRLTEVEPDKAQPRKHFDDAALGELADSISQHLSLIHICLCRRAAGRANGAVYADAGRRGQSALQSVHRRHRQGTPGAGSGRFGRRDGSCRGRHVPAKPDAEHGQGARGAFPARSNGPQTLSYVHEKSAGRNAQPAAEAGGDHFPHL